MSSYLSQKLAKAKFAFVDEAFCLDGPLNQKRDKALADLLEAQTKIDRARERSGEGDVRLNDTSVRDAERALETIEEEMREALIVLRFTAVSDGQWNKWVVQHPIRKGNELDKSMGFNTDVFFRDVAKATAQVFAPETEETFDISDAEWEQIVEAMTSGDWDRVSMSILRINQREGQNGPDFLLSGFKRPQDSAPTSDSPAT